jgi:sporulation protein YlmC with PRC-barrel domain
VSNAHEQEDSLTKRIIIALALSTVSGVALAQTGAPAEKSKAPAPPTMPSKSTDKMRTPSTTTGQAPAASTTTTKSADADAEKGLRMADSATVAVRFVTVEPAGIMSSRLIGANVYNNQQESLGEVTDLVIDDGKTLTGVIVSVGGFLGIGESYVVMDPSTIVVNERDGALRAYVDTSKENLESAPKFKYPADKS